MNKIRAAALAAVAFLTAVAVFDETNIVSQIARKAIEILQFAILGTN